MVQPRWNRIINDPANPLLGIYTRKTYRLIYRDKSTRMFHVAQLVKNPPAMQEAWV